MTARFGCDWVKFWECGELLYGRRFPLRLKGDVHRSYVRPAMLCGSEAWCLRESEMGILRRAERSTVKECVEYSSLLEKDLQIFCSCWV